MKRYLFSLVLIFSLIGQSHPQSIPSIIFSPTQNHFQSIPYADIEFAPVRLQGLGVQLHNVVADTVSELFRNPVSIYNLKEDLLTTVYEQNKTITLPVQPMSSILTVGNLFNVNPLIPPIIFEQTGSNFYYSPRITRLGVYPNYPLFSAGYWSSPNGILKIPFGLFIKGGLTKEDNSLSPPEYPGVNFSGRGTSNQSFAESVDVTDFFGQAWLGLLNTDHFKLSFCYNLYYNETSASISRTSKDSSLSRDRIRLNKDVIDDHFNSEWIRHKVTMGAQLTSGEWRIEPALSILFFSNALKDRIFDQNFYLTYVQTYPDSIIYLSKDELVGNFDLDRNLTGIEFDLQARSGRTVLFGKGFYANLSPEESAFSQTDQLRIDYGDTTEFGFNSSKSDFADDGSLFRLRGGIGRNYFLKGCLQLYTAVVLQYNRHDLSGALSEESTDRYQSLFSDPTEIDTSLQNSVDVNTNQFTLSLPVGLEMKWKFLFLRFGLNGIYWHQKNDARFKNRNNKTVFHGDQTNDQLFLNEFFGIGLKWKKAELNIAAFGDILGFSSWNAGLRYHL